MKFQFPHFSHRIHARLVFGLEMVVLWFGLGTLIAVNILTIQKGRPAYWNRLMILFEAPFTVSRHIDLASLLWQQGYEEARRLMVSAQALTKASRTGASRQTANVLGETTYPLATLAQWEHEAEKLKGKYAFWQSVAAAKPDYRDAYVMLAALTYQLGQIDDARAWLAKAQALDPNSPTVQTLVALLE